MLDTNLKSKINKLWDKFWSGGLSNPITAIEQMSYLIFMKKLEDEDNKRDQEAKFTGEKLAFSGDRIISLPNCDAKIGKKVKVTLTREKYNVFYGAVK